MRLKILLFGWNEGRPRELTRYEFVRYTRRSVNLTSICLCDMGGCSGDSGRRDWLIHEPSPCLLYDDCVYCRTCRWMVLSPSVMTLCIYSLKAFEYKNAMMYFTRYICSFVLFTCGDLFCCFQPLVFYSRSRQSSQTGARTIRSAADIQATCIA